jgi:hypothetical protein
MVKRLQVVAQVVGMVVIGLLIFSGVASLFNGTNPVMAALGLRAPQAPQAPQAMEPSIVNYQGMLYDDLGAPLSGEYDLTFRLYDDPIAPVTETLWTESIPGVTVRDGRFSVLLGDTSPIDAGDFAQADTYIGIQVEAYDELVPRQRFVSVPYAFYATRASGLTAPDGDPLNAVTVDNDGKVGIGTATPTQKLDVDNGNLLVQGIDSFEGSGDEALVWLGDTNHFIKSHWGEGVTIGTSGAPNGIVLEENTGDVTVSGNMTVNGDVGIGTINPTQKLDVDNGNLLVQGTGSFDALGEEALVYLGDTNHFIKSHWGEGVTIGTSGAPNGIVLEENTGDVTVAGNIAWTGHLSSLTVTGEYSAESWHQGWMYTTMVSAQNSICFLTRVAFEETDTNEEMSYCVIEQYDGNWRLGAFGHNSFDNEALCSARCLQW